MLAQYLKTYCNSWANKKQDNAETQSGLQANESNAQATGFATLPNDPTNAQFSNALNTLIAGIFAAIALTGKLFFR